MKKSDIVVGGKYLFNTQGKNIYDAFNPRDKDAETIIEVVVIKIYERENWKGDLEVSAEDCEQTIRWSELLPLK